MSETLGDPTIFQDVPIRITGDTEEIVKMFDKMPQPLCGEFRFRDKLNLIKNVGERHARMSRIPLEEASIVFQAIGWSDEGDCLVANFAFLPWAQLAYKAYKLYPERCYLVARRVKLIINDEVIEDNIVAIDMEYEITSEHMPEIAPEEETGSSEPLPPRDAIDAYCYAVEKAGYQFQQKGQELFGKPAEAILSRLSQAFSPISDSSESEPDSEQEGEDSHTLSQ